MYKEVCGQKYFFLNVPSVWQGVTIFCAPKNMGTNVYSAMKKKVWRYLEKW